MSASGTREVGVCEARRDGDTYPLRKRGKKKWKTGKTYDQQHEILQHVREMAVARDGDGAVDDGADEGPDEARDRGRPPAHDLQGEGDAVDVGAIVPDDAEREHDEAELAEAAQRRQHLGQEHADIGAVALGERRVIDGGGDDGQAQHLGEAEREDQAGEGPEEDFGLGAVGGLVDGVVGGVAGPAGGEAEHGGGEGEHGAGLGLAHAHGDVVELARVRELAQHDEEDDEARDPAVVLVGVHDFVAEEGDEEGRGRDDDDAGPAWDGAVDGVEDLRPDDDVHGGPADAGEDVEERDCDSGSVRVGR